MVGLVWWQLGMREKAGQGVQGWLPWTRGSQEMEKAMDKRQKKT